MIDVEDFDTRLVTLESKIDHLTDTLAEAMKLFSHSESSEHIELTERRFQINLKDTEGIQSRYRGAEYSVSGIEIQRYLPQENRTTGGAALHP